MLKTIVEASENFCIHQIRKPHVLHNTIQTKKEVDYRAIANFLSNEIYHFITTTSDAEVKQWGRQLLSKLADKHSNLF